MADFRQGTSGWPEDDEEAQASGSKALDAKERAARRVRRREEQEDELQKIRDRLDALDRARAEREAKEAAERPQVPFRDTEEGQGILAWKDAPVEERMAQARKMAKRPSPIPGLPLLAAGTYGALWQEALGVDATGTLVRP